MVECWIDLRILPTKLTKLFVILPGSAASKTLIDGLLLFCFSTLRVTASDLGTLAVKFQLKELRAL